MAKREKDAQVMFRLTEDVARKFKSECALRGTSIQAVLEQAVKEFLAQEEKPE